MCVYPALPRKYIFSNPEPEFLESDVFEKSFPICFSVCFFVQAAVLLSLSSVWLCLSFCLDPWSWDIL